MIEVQLFLLPYGAALPRLAAAERLFLFGIKKKQKMPAENFSFKASEMASSAETNPDSYRDVRLD